MLCLSRFNHEVNSIIKLLEEEELAFFDLTTASYDFKHTLLGKAVGRLTRLHDTLDKTHAKLIYEQQTLFKELIGLGYGEPQRFTAFSHTYDCSGGIFQASRGIVSLDDIHLSMLRVCTVRLNGNNQTLW